MAALQRQGHRFVVCSAPTSANDRVTNVTAGRRRCSPRSPRASRWDAMVVDFRETLSAFEMPVELQEELIAIVAATKEDIVTVT